MTGGTDGITATIDPAHGASVARLRLPDDCDLLWRIGSELRSRFREIPPSLDSEDSRSQATWMSQSVGGWEIMAPNAGSRGTVDGVVYPFHGSAGRSAWQVKRASAREAQLEVHLPIHNLVVRRQVRLDGMHCRVTETLVNNGERTCQVAWGSHLAFGGHLLDGDLRLHLHGDILGGTLNGVPANVESLRELLHSPREGQSALVYLRADNGRGQAVLCNISRGLSVKLTWDAITFPFLWIWVELGGTTVWPFFGNVRALGLEPVSSWPAVGVEHLPSETNTQVVLEPGGVLHGDVELAVTTDTQAAVRAGVHA